MIGDITVADEIYIVCGYTDMRKSIDGLCAIVEDKLHMDPRRSAIFLFCGRRADRIKILMWEADGFVLLYKRLSALESYGAGISEIPFRRIAIFIIWDCQGAPVSSRDWGMFMGFNPCT